MRTSELFFFLLLAPLLLLSPLLFGGKALFWGTPALQFIPWWKVAWDSVLSAEWPLWNPFLGMGAPLLANYQSALLYPLTWIYFFFYVLGGVPAMAWAQTLVIWLHLVWAGLGMAALARALGLKPLAQGVSALAFSLSGYLVARAWFASINATVAWLPWVLLFSLQVVRHKRKSALGYFVLTVAMMLLAGHAQTAWYSLLLTGVWSLYWSRFIPGWRERLRSLVSLAAAFLLAVMLAAPQLLLTAEYLLQSARAEAVAYDFAMTYSFWPWRFLELIAARLFGSPVTGDYWGYGNYWEDALYVGLLPFLLALSALLAAVGGRRERGAASPADIPASLPVLLLGFAVAAFALALGKNTPLFPWLYRHVPTFDMFQAPTRWTLWVEFSLALLAGLGAHRWHHPEGRGLYWTRLATAGAFAIALGAGLTLLALGEVRLTMVRAVTLTGLWGLGSGALALSMPADDSLARRLWEPAVLVWVAADLLVAGWGLLPGIELAFYHTPSPQAAALRDMLGDGRLYFPPAEEDALKYKHFLRFDTFHPAGVQWEAMRAALLPNLNVLDAVPAVNNFDPLVPGRYARWMQVLSEAEGEMQERMLDAMSVTVVEHRRTDAGGAVAFYPRQGLPRAYWVGCARFVPDGERALALVQDEHWDPRLEVVVEGEMPVGAEACVQSEAEVVPVQQSFLQQVWRVETPSSGWLVVTDLWYPGWEATVDGRPARLWRGNYLFRAVYLPGGEHRVALNYRPPLLRVGLVLAALGWLSFGLLILRWRTLGYNE